MWTRKTKSEKGRIGWHGPKGKIQMKCQNKIHRKTKHEGKKKGRYYIIIDNFISAHVLSRWEVGATNFINILVISLNLYDNLY